MKQIICVCSLIAFLVYGSAAQSSSDGEPVLSRPDTIAAANFKIIAYRIISNPYNSKSKNYGKKFYELSGYRLAEALQILAREAKAIVRIKELVTNPQIAIRIEFNRESFTFIWPEVLKSMAEHYGFSISSTVDSMVIKTLTISNLDLLHKNKSKSLPKGVEKLANISKNGRVELIGYTLTDLAAWLTEIWNQPVELVQTDNGTRYTFNFASTSFIKEVLPEIYGLDVQERIALRQIQVITR